jgi:DNA repair protein RecO (recombination protein O)
MSRQLRERRDEESAFVLHTYPYRETSLIVEAFTASYGRVAMVARGAKRPRSELRGLLNAFQPLLLSWAGTGELKTLVAAEWRGGMPLPTGAGLLCGFYLNELLLKLLPREDPHPKLWIDYEDALLALTEHSTPAEQAATLRRFELRLLSELGYAMSLTHEQGTGAPIEPRNVTITLSIEVRGGTWPNRALTGRSSAVKRCLHWRMSDITTRRSRRKRSG